MARAFTGAAAAALIPLTIAYIGDVVPYARRQTALATLMASAGAAQALSMGAGGALSRVLSWRGLFPVLGGLAGLVTLVLFAAARHESAGRAGTARPSYRAALQTDLTPLLWVVCVEGALFMGGFPFLSGLLEQRFGLEPWAIGLLLALGGASQVLVARALPWLLRRYSEPELVSIGGAAMGLAYLLAALAPSTSWVGGASLLLGGGFSVCHSTLQTRATEVFPSGRGSALSLFAFSLFLGGGLGSLGLGWLLERTGYGLGFALVALCWLPLTSSASRLVRRPLPAPLDLRVPAVVAEPPSR
jgi:predicted MFS family arabinose efflux permease